MNKYLAFIRFKQTMQRTWSRFLSLRSMSLFDVGPTGFTGFGRTIGCGPYFKPVAWVSLLPNAKPGPKTPPNLDHIFVLIETSFVPLTVRKSVYGFE